jgi:hypothetical protein
MAPLAVGLALVVAAASAVTCGGGDRSGGGFAGCVGAGAVAALVGAAVSMPSPCPVAGAFVSPVLHAAQIESATMAAVFAAALAAELQVITAER